MKLDDPTIIVRVAQALPDDERVPYAFEKRIMALIRSPESLNVWNLWSSIFGKAAFCSVGILVLTSAYVRLADNNPSQDLMAADLERTVMAGVTQDETW